VNRARLPCDSAAVFGADDVAHNVNVGEETMKTLVIGGTGGIGGHIALDLEKLGHKVTVSARNKPNGTPIAHMPFLKGSYIDGSITEDQLKGFDNLIFSACNDIRQLPQGLSAKDEADYYHHANTIGVPRFIRMAKDAGVKRCAYIGSFYVQARPDLVDGSSYIQSRKGADEGARALADESFRVVSLNAPWVVGAMKGASNPIYDGLVQYAKGKLPDLPVFAMPGGVNFISVQSLSDATIASLTKGQNGYGYLVGDENLRFKEFFHMFFKGVGRGDVDIPVRNEPHPIFADMALLAGRDGVIFYENQGVKELGYRQNDIYRTVKDICDTAP
jgi:nucleoside-diphosphate-sugar epimerase